MAVREEKRKCERPVTCCVLGPTHRHSCRFYTVLVIIPSRCKCFPKCTSFYSPNMVPPSPNMVTCYSSLASSSSSIVSPIPVFSVSSFFFKIVLPLGILVFLAGDDVPSSPSSSKSTMDYLISLIFGGEASSSLDLITLFTMFKQFSYNFGARPFPFIFTP